MELAANNRKRNRTHTSPFSSPSYPVSNKRVKPSKQPITPKLLQPIPIYPVNFSFSYREPPIQGQNPFNDLLHGHEKNKNKFGNDGPGTNVVRRD
jgi:hypothetical protein